jgi:ABC-2 type transport system ATP-binding protein
MTDALETDGLGRRYRSTWGLRDCSLTVRQGSITGLVGPNGAGKSTLLRLAAGLSRPTTGTVRVFGTEVAPNSPAHLGRMGYFDQQRPLYTGFRVEEMLRFGRLLNHDWDDVAARGWLAEFDIPLDRKVGKLSLGQQAQVALAVCMGKRPDLLLLDEPVASLDPLARRQLLQTLLATVAERGTTVFLSSHIVSELEPVCDELIILSAARVQTSGSIEGLLDGHRLLVGPRIDTEPTGADIVSSSSTSRQTTLLVRGTPPELGPDWQVLAPGLEEIVLAYLANPGAGTGASVTTGESGGTGESGEAPGTGETGAP